MRGLRAELRDALGGETLTPMQCVILDRAVEKAARCALLSKQMLGGGDMATEAERRYAWHANSLRHDLQVLGLERRAKAEPGLREILGGKA